MTPVLAPHNSVCLRFFQETKLSRVGLVGVEGMGLVALP